MSIVVRPTYLQGEIIVPSSKSYLQRAIAAATLSFGKSKITHNGHCNDSFAALSIAKQLGASIKENDNTLTIKGDFAAKSNVLDCHESGLCFRMFAPILALLNKEITLTGSGSLSKRPQQLIVNALRQFNVKVEATNGFLPLKISGQLNGTSAIIDASVSSQLLTGLLMALPLSKADSHVEVRNLMSIPYIKMTIDLLSKFGIIVPNSDNKHFTIRGSQVYKGCDYNVEGDWSAASFFIAGAMINGEVTIRGLNMNSLQADIAIIELLKKNDADMTLLSEGVSIKAKQIKAFEFDATHCPDLFPPLVAMAAHALGISKITGVNRLIYKESNRALALVEEFAKLGIKIKIDNDIMFITGGQVNSAKVFSHNDHRIAMALAITAIGADGIVEIFDIDCINKSYPNFFKDFNHISLHL